EKVEKRKRSKKRKPSATLEQPSDSNSDGEESVPKRHLIRPMKFDGSGSFETFLAHFQNSASHNEWSNTEQLAWLKASLVREAGQALWDSSPESTNTLEKLIELLKNRFGGTRQTDKYRMEVRLRRRKPNESLSALHQDIRRLMAPAHPDVPASAREVIACDYCIDSLDDSEFGLKVRERNPSSLDDALRVSLQLEAWTRDSTRQKSEELSMVKFKQ